MFVLNFLQVYVWRPYPRSPLSELFDAVRQWSYKAIREFWAPSYRRTWDSAVYDQAKAINAQFKVPLPVSEVKSIAKSTANWTYRKFTPEKKSQWHAKKGAKGGKVSKGGGRPSLNEPWIELGISRATYFRRKKSGSIE